MLDDPDRRPTREEAERAVHEALSAFDPVVNPRHYTQHPSGVECIDITEHMSFNLGNAVKYIWRAPHKGKPVEDLRKAVWCLEREIKRMQGNERNCSAL
jgi:hypothetical protein